MNKTPGLESQVLEITAGWLPVRNSSSPWLSEVMKKSPFFPWQLHSWEEI